MTEHVTRQEVGAPDIAPGFREATREITGLWWTWLVAGIAWIVISLVILQFDAASVTTVSVLLGLMFALAGIQTFALTALPGATRWVSAVFAVLFMVSAVICFIDPKGTFAGLADVLGFLFLVVGVWWVVRAFIERAVNPLWWLGLISGALMTILAFWTAGQFFVEKAYVLLVFAGIWALMQGVTDIVRAFTVRQLNKSV
jgi:uncharacterized membrane protein HdeD (DUF308 family)